MKGKLGILDWGIGGFGLYKAIKEKEDINTVYLSDAGFTPYGKVPEKKLKARTLKCIGFLENQGVTQVVVACNAAGSVILDQPYTNVVLAGRSLLEQYKRSKIGILGGQRLVDSYLFPSFYPKSDIVQAVAQEMSAHIEAGTQNDPAANKKLKKILAPLKDREVILLACTHYPAISKQIINALNNKVEILDPVQILVKQILWEHDFGLGTNEVFTTGSPEQTIISAKKAFGVELESVTKIEL